MKKSGLFLSVLTLLFLFSASLFAQKTTVAGNAADTSPLKTGETLPNVTLKNVNGEAVDLNNLVSQKPTVLIFYRGGWCPF